MDTKNHSIFLFQYKFIYFNWRLITLQYCIGFAIHQHESTTGIHVPHPELHSHLHPHTIPLGHPSAPAPSILYHALNLDWRCVSYIILYMFQCHSLKSSLTLSHRVQKTVLYIWVSFAVSHTGLPSCKSSFGVAFSHKSPNQISPCFDRVCFNFDPKF